MIVFESIPDRFLNGFDENVISGQRSIRIFGKRFMESEMASILVEVLLKKTTKFIENQQNTLTLLLDSM